ncbi:hypothetical protein N7539_007546 [Penicillium diatomitis]|uniref:Uncharacterized protein n=1 Tax=Penicillium diatomitis TaxID=2819901 RepID=A0A9W9WVG5_9EURO|nr:uncharacterized protein N7539_007546 [Penicillium diatomitis]KAJ5477402.1 hypothetical protein N7539_007546 [Penicillium diatomitis]
MIVLRTNYHYYGLVIALARLKMHICRQDQYSQQEESKRLLMDTARAIVEESKNIEIAAHTPIYILAVLPLAALFILFDFIVHNPTHPETRDNLSLLDVVAGHFSLLDYKSGGFLPASLLTEFAQIARQYVRDFASTSTQEPPPPPPQQQLPHQQQAEESLGGVDVALSWPSQTATENMTDLNREETSGDGSTDYRPNIMETWEPRDYLHYPVSPEFGMADTSTMGALNFQSLFGFVVPDFQCGDEV